LPAGLVRLAGVVSLDLGDDILGRLAPRASIHQGLSSRRGGLTQSRLQLYGYAIAIIYGAFLLSAYNAGNWIVDAKGIPIYTDFACEWIAAVQAMQGHSALLYDPATFVEMQAALVGPGADLYPNWPYPPIFLLIMAPFAALRYRYAFVAWDLTTLLACIAVIYAIIRNLAVSGVPIYRLEFSRRAKWVSDRLAARSIIALP
jgi:hypothetical protein